MAGRAWTDIQEASLVELLGEGLTVVQIAAVLKRTRASVESKIHKLKLGTKAAWTEEELEILRENYPSQGSRTQVFGRSSQAISLKAERLGIRFKDNKWTEEELEILRTNYASQGPRTQIVGRTREAIRRKADQLGISRQGTGRWTREELKILRKDYPRLGGQTKILGRSQKSIGLKACKLGLRYQGKRGPKRKSA